MYSYKSYIILCLFFPLIFSKIKNQCGSDDWYVYKNEKCFKPIFRFGTHESSSRICNEESIPSETFIPTLAQINSPEEQEFLTNLIFHDLGLMNNLWIGAIRLENSSRFVWDDGSDVTYENWGEGSPSEDNVRNCVEMQSALTRHRGLQLADLENSPLGKWKNVICSKGNFILCQKPSTMSFPTTSLSEIPSEETTITEDFISETITYSSSTFPTISTKTTTTTTLITTKTTTTTPITTTTTTNLSTTQAIISTSSLKPITTTQRITSAKPIICNYDGEYNGIQGVDWPPVYSGEFSVVNCTKGNGIMKWKCLSYGKFDGEMPDVSDCWINDILDKIDNITQIEEVQEVLDTITNGTETNSSLSSSDGLKDIVTIVEKLQDKLNLTEVYLDVATNLTTQFIKVFNNLIDQNNAWNNATQTEKTDISSKILINIQYTSFILSCSLNRTKEKEMILTQNIIVETYFSNFEEQLKFEANKSSITIPSGLNLNIERECKNSSVASLIDKLDNYLLGGIVENQIMNSKIISFSLTKANKTTQINDGLKVRMRLSHKQKLEFGDRIVCKYWDYSKNMWSTDGCVLVKQESNRYVTVCECNHLTNFAALMDYTERNDTLKSLLTHICCGLSVLFLIFTIIVLLLPNERNKLASIEKLKDKSNLIIFNLCICLIVANLLVIFGMDNIEFEPQWICRTISALLLYSLLASFSWMLIEGLHIYHMIVYVFKKQTKVEITLLFGYGIPLFFIGFNHLIIYFTEGNALFDVNIEDYYFCWIASEKHSNHIWVFTVPVIVVIVVNTYVMVILLRKVLKINTQKERTEKFKSKSKLILSFSIISINLGITWFLFVLYIQKWSSYFSYLSYVFIVLNGSQGIFIFIYQVVLFNKQKARITMKYMSKSTSENRTSSSNNS